MWRTSEYLAHLLQAERGRGAEAVLSYLREQHWSPHLPSSCHMESTKQAQPDITRLIRGTENTACGHQCTLVSYRLQTNHSREQSRASTASTCFCQGGTWGSRRPRLQGEPHGAAGAVLCPLACEGQGSALAGFLQGPLLFLLKIQQCCNKVWCSYLKTKLRKRVVLNDETIINSRTSQ